MPYPEIEPCCKNCCLCHAHADENNVMYRCTMTGLEVLGGSTCHSFHPHMAIKGAIAEVSQRCGNCKYYVPRIHMISQGNYQHSEREGTCHKSVAQRASPHGACTKWEDGKPVPKRSNLIRKGAEW